MKQALGVFFGMPIYAQVIAILVFSNFVSIARSGLLLLAHKKGWNKAQSGALVFASAFALGLLAGPIIRVSERFGLLFVASTFIYFCLFDLPTMEARGELN